MDVVNLCGVEESEGRLDLAAAVGVDGDGDVHL